jgi:protein tyrosine phosphatase
LPQPENAKKNRYFPHVLPYDHCRVVLSELANATGSDYINASTIVSAAASSWTAVGDLL